MKASSQYDDYSSTLKEYDEMFSIQKEYQGNLSINRVKTLQEYAKFANALVLDNIPATGAYNFLINAYTKHDSQNSLITENIMSTKDSIIPNDINDSAKTAYIKALNVLDKDESFKIAFVLSIDIESIKQYMAQYIQKLSSYEIQYMKNFVSFDLDFFIQNTISQPYNQHKRSYNSILLQIDDILEQKNSKHSSDAFLECATIFLNTFIFEYKRAN